LHLVGVQQGVGVVTNLDTPQESAFQAVLDNLMLGFESQGLTSSNGGVTTVAANSKIGHVVRGKEKLANSHPSRLGCLCGSIYSEDQESYYNSMNAPNYLPRQ
jgi:hypothetical protein